MLPLKFMTAPAPSDSSAADLTRTMAWLDFWEGVVASLAWPLLLAVIVICFRRQLGQLIERLRSAKAWGVELDTGLDKAAEAVELAQVPAAVASRTPLPNEPASSTGDGEREDSDSDGDVHNIGVANLPWEHRSRREELNDTDVRLTSMRRERVQDKWSELERLLRLQALRSGIKRDKKTGVRTNEVLALANAGVVSPLAADAVLSLRIAAQRLLASEKITAAQANSFIESADQTLPLLDSTLSTLSDDLKERRE